MKTTAFDTFTFSKKCAENHITFSLLALKFDT